jgi:hypothetical protein
MKRLSELKVVSPSMKEAQRLLASLEPLPEDSERMWRIRRELDWVFLNTGHGTRASGLRLRGITVFHRQLSAATVAGVLLLLGASAFAAVRLISALVGSRAERHATAPAQLTAALAQPGQAHSSAAEEPSDQVPSDLAAPLPSDPQHSLSSRDPEAKSPVLRARQARRMAARMRVQRIRAQRAAASEPTSYIAPDTSHEAPNEAPAQRTASADYAAPETSQEAQHTEQGTASAIHKAARGVTDNDLARKEAKPSESTGTSGEAGSELVHRALRALRRDGDAALAARLLERHRARDPDGPLVEEALALQIEASVALGQPRARGFAREYLTRYPGGRYRSVAERVLANSKP